MIIDEALFQDYSERISNETFEVGENCLSIFSSTYILMKPISIRAD